MNLSYELYTEGGTGHTSIRSSDGGEILWSGPATVDHGGGHTTCVYVDFDNMRLCARVRVTKMVEADEDGFSGMLFKYVADEIDLTDETVARFGLRLERADNSDPIGLTWLQ